MSHYRLTVAESLAGSHSTYSGDQLPFICPYEIQKTEDNKNGLDPGLLGSPGTDLTTVSRNFYAEYRAATAIVPCDATPMRVFTEDKIEGKEYTVAVIFVYESSVGRIKEWLK